MHPSLFLPSQQPSTKHLFGERPRKNWSLLPLGPLVVSPPCTFFFRPRARPLNEPAASSLRLSPSRISYRLSLSRLSRGPASTPPTALLQRERRAITLDGKITSSKLQNCFLKRKLQAPLWIGAVVGVCIHVYRLSRPICHVFGGML